MCGLPSHGGDRLLAAVPMPTERLAVPVPCAVWCVCEDGSDVPRALLPYDCWLRGEVASGRVCALGDDKTSFENVTCACALPDLSECSDAREEEKPACSAWSCWCAKLARVGETSRRVAVARVDAVDMCIATASTSP